MADRWWVNDDADGDWNNANNWSTTEGGAGGAGVPTSSDNALFSDTSSSDDCTLSANSVCGNLYTGSADTGGTDNYSGTIDISTYNLTNSGATKIASGATLKIGVSADTGLTTAGLRYESGSTADYQTTSKINNSGDYYCHNSIVFVADNTGDYTQSGDGIFTSTRGANDHFNVTINSGVTLTPTNFSRVVSSGSNNFTHHGVLACGSNFINIGCAGTVTFGANCDFTGDGVIAHYYGPSITVINNKSVPFSFTGIVNNVSGGSRTYITGDWRYADVVLQGSSTLDTKWIGSAGILKCKNFSVSTEYDFNVTVDNAINNTSLEISGNVDIHAGTGTYTTIWTKGTGTITLTGSSGTQTLNFNGKSIEDIIVNASGATKQLTDSVTTESLTVTAGTFDIQTYNCTVSGATDITGTLKIGVSADTGLSTHGWIVNSGATVDMQTESVINLYPGTVDIYSSATWTLAPAGSYIIHSGTIDWDGLEYTQRPYKFTQNDGSVINLSKNAYFGNQAMHSNILNGVINVGTHVLTIGAENVFTIGANCDLTGTGDVRFGIDAGANITWNCTTSFSHTGNMQFADRTSPGNVMPAANFSNSNIVIRHYSGSLPRMIIISDVQCDGLCCKSFLLEATSSSVAEELIIDNSANCDINISGDLDWTDAVATYDVTYIAGTGTMTFMGASGTQTINSNGVALGNIVIDAAGAVKQLANDIDVSNLNCVAGTFNPNAKTITITNSLTLGQNCTITGLEGSTFIVGGNFIASGAGVGSELDLTAASEWILTISGLGSAQYVDVSYSNASGGSTIHAIDSIDSGNTQNWDFTPAPVTPQGLRAIHRRPLPQLAIFSDGLW